MRIFVTLQNNCNNMYEKKLKFKFMRNDYLTIKLAKNLKRMYEL